MRSRALLFLPTVLTLSLAVRAEDPPPSRAILNRAEAASLPGLGGGQSSHAFWDGCEPGTEVEFRTDSRAGDRRQEQTLTYRILSREGAELKVHLKGSGADQEFVCRAVPPRDPGEEDPFRDPAVDSEGGSETLTVGGREYACRIFERATKFFPECGTGEPRYRILRIRAWHSPDFPAQGGIAKIVQTHEEEWGEGPQVKVETTFEVTNPAAKASIDGVEIACYALSTTRKQDGKIQSRGEQLRLDPVPGGVLETTDLYLDDSGKEQARYRVWISRLSIVRKAEIEKRK